MVISPNISAASCQSICLNPSAKQMTSSCISRVAAVFAGTTLLLVGILILTEIHGLHSLGTTAGSSLIGCGSILFLLGACLSCRSKASNTTDRLGKPANDADNTFIYPQPDLANAQVDTIRHSLTKQNQESSVFPKHQAKLNHRLKSVQKQIERDKRKLGELKREKERMRQAFPPEAQEKMHKLWERILHDGHVDPSEIEEFEKIAESYTQNPETKTYPPKSQSSSGNQNSKKAPYYRALPKTDNEEIKNIRREYDRKCRAVDGKATERLKALEEEIEASKKTHQEKRERLVKEHEREQREIEDILEKIRAAREKKL